MDELNELLLSYGIASLSLIMTTKTPRDKALHIKATHWKGRIGKAVLIVSLCTLLIYLAWIWQHVFFYVLVGLFMMGLSYLMPLREVDASQELCWDLFAFVITLAVFLQICDIGIGQPSVNFFLGVDRIQQFHQWVARWPLWAAIICYYVVVDFITYWGHRLLHNRWFWPAHAFHHSAKNLNWISGMRSTLIHNIAIFLPYTVVWVFFPTPKAGMIATALLIFEISNQHYLHSNIRLPMQKQLEWLFVTPRFHFVHHSAFKARTDSNYGFIFSVWDRIFGTYTDPDTVDPHDPLGLDYEISNWRLLIGLPRPK